MDNEEDRIKEPGQGNKKRVQGSRSERLEEIGNEDGREDQNKGVKAEK